MTKLITNATIVKAIQLKLVGQVQGIGFRPVLARLARQLDVTGWVCNTTDGIELHIEGEPDAISRFTRDCRQTCPTGGQIESVHVCQAECQNKRSFEIINASTLGQLSTPIPVDRVTCAVCLSETFQPDDRRFGFLLNSCCQCGPRYTILDRLPYERESTSMKGFQMCGPCQSEYNAPDHRRYHAQTNCCKDCGPKLLGLQDALSSLKLGQIVAVKGLGGYQLIGLASNLMAISHLRTLKGRLSKPLAVMVADINQARRFGELSALHCELLHSDVGPIVIVPVSSQEQSNEITGGLNSIGLMLPTTPLHAWLVRSTGPLVVTSANLEGEPIAYRSGHEQNVSSLTSVWIDHDRPIRRPLDDSVVQVVAGRQSTVRLARGLTPALLDLPPHLLKHQILAVGGHQKVAIAICNGSQAVLGPHCGDMETTASRRRFAEHIQDWLTLYRFTPQAIAHDLHDDYFTSRWAQQHAASSNVPTVVVQHHHAHIVSGMLESGWLQEDVLGFAWDGTGMGSDGSLWGGEAMLASSTDFRRIASLRPFPLLGGEAAIREPARVAAVMLREVQLWDQHFEHRAEWIYPLESLLNLDYQHPLTSSVGRLFDAVATLILPSKLLGDGRAGYEGHFAALMESVCDLHVEGYYELEIVASDERGGRPAYELDWRPLIRAVVRDQRDGVAISTMATRFHRTLARAISQVGLLIRDLPIVLSGGVFQNRILVELVVQELKSQQRRLATPGQIPVNDGGLAAGQLAIASSQLENLGCV